VIFVNAPVDSACNPHITDDIHHDACWLAGVGIAAAHQGKFWQFHDELFQRLPITAVDAQTVAGRLDGLGIDRARVQREMESGAVFDELSRDIELCDTLKITSVPALVINGHVRGGGISPASLEAILRAMLLPDGGKSPRR